MTQTPTILVVLGATGDLMAKKIVPAVFHLYKEGNLPEKFRLLGVSRRDWHDEEFQKHVKAILDVKVPNASLRDVDAFLKIVSYHKLEFHQPDDYHALGDALMRMDAELKTCANKLFYLSVPPQFYGNIFDNLYVAKLAQGCGGKNDGWTRIIVEKPFGSDEKSAKALDAKLAKLFKEEQIYRIDHYLAKDAFQNVLAFRFFNNLFENQWGTKLIESIHVRQLESVGIEERGDSYDGVGALKDVGQNHLLQMVALAAMDKPEDMTADAICSARAAFLAKLAPLSPREAKSQTFRGQYDGYRLAEGVARDSDTETYFRVAFSVASPRWRGVEFTIEAGKRVVDKKIGGRITEIEVVFRHPRPCWCPGAYPPPFQGGVRGGSATRKEGSLPSPLLGKEGDAPPRHYKNSVTFSQDPKENITMKFWAKKQGLGMELEKQTFDFNVRGESAHSRASADYEKLLSDCITGDQTLFVSSKEIAAMWRFIDPIIAGWRKGIVPLRRYAPDSDAVVAEAEVAMEKQ